MNLFSKIFGALTGNPNKKKPVPEKKRSNLSTGTNVKSSGSVRLPSTRVIGGEKDLDVTNWELISGSFSSAEFHINEQMKKKLAVLRIANFDSEKKECILLSKKESYGDTAFLEIVEQVRAKGYHIKETCLSDSGFLSKLYESSVSITERELDPESQALVHALDRELIQVAIDRGASDIHISLREDSVKVSMREDGELQPSSDWGLDQTKRLIRVLFMLADEKTKDTALSDDVGQSMSIKRIINGANVKLRVQTETAYPQGKDIVMRVLLEGVDAKVKSLEELGYSTGHIRMLDTMMSTPNGAIIVAGVTGSGKSTTLQTLMSNIREANPGKKMYSIEDPPEYILKGVTQIPVKSGGKNQDKKGDGNNNSPYAETMRNAMRMDPDVLMPGELRDKTSVEMFTGMVQSGHKVLTSLHAASAFGIIERLAKLGLDVTEASGRNFISGLIYQALVPLLCVHCKVPYRPTEWSDYNGLDDDIFANNDVIDINSRTNVRGFRGVLGMSGIHSRIKEVWRPGAQIYVRGSGCPYCKGGGKGRTACAEMVLLSARMREFLNVGNIEGAYQCWKGLRKPGNANDDNVSAMAGMSALDHALIKLRDGLVSPIDVESSLGFLTGYELDDQILDEASSNLNGLG